MPIVFSIKKCPYKIFRFISQHLDYSEIDCQETSISALEAFRLHTGSCLGYSRLLVALYRAAGIPAQIIIGTILPDDATELRERLNRVGIPTTARAEIAVLAASPEAGHAALVERVPSLLASAEFTKVGLVVLEGPVGLLIVEIFAG